MFDITAPLERQSTRDGRKVLAIFDSKLDIFFPICAWFSGRDSSLQLTKNGYYSISESPFDIITLPEKKPLICWWNNICESKAGQTFLTEDGSLNCITESVITIVKITFDPNNGNLKSEIVWKKEC